MADESSEIDTEHRIRELHRDFAREPLPDPPVSDEHLVAMLRARLREEQASGGNTCPPAPRVGDEGPA
jgi:hypothetical protein